MFVLASEMTGVERSLLTDMRRGEAGFFPRIGASIAVGAGLSATLTLILGILDAADDDTALLVAIPITLVLLLFALKYIWSGYPHHRRLLATSFHILVIWSVAVPLCIWIDGEFHWGERDCLIAGVILAGVAASLWLITTRWYRNSAGRPVIAPRGEVNVRCPECGYSLVGLQEARCPECGTRYTLDELIRQQEYAPARQQHAQRQG